MIAFLTAVGDHVFEGYEVQAVRYLMKPLQQEKLSELLELAAKAFSEQPKVSDSGSGRRKGKSLS